MFRTSFSRLGVEPMCPTPPGEMPGGCKLNAAVTRKLAGEGFKGRGRC